MSTATFKPRRRAAFPFKAAFSLLLLGGLLVLPILVPCCTQENVEILVTGKERITTGSGNLASSKWIVWTPGETFRNTDCLWLGKFSSADLQGKLAVGTTYRARVYGWRIPILSRYRNIVTAEPIGKAVGQ